MNRKNNRLLWALQLVLAALFLFAGSAKLLTPAAALAAQSPLPVGLMRFVGVAEVCGALGLLLPGLTGIRRVLMSWAALGLVLIMAGAVTVTLATGGGPSAAVPLVVGALLAVIAWARRPGVTA